MARTTVEDMMAALQRADKRLGRVITRVGPFKIEQRHRVETFPSLLRSIVYQQLTGKAAGTIHGRVLEAAGGGELHPGPAAFVALGEERLRAAGLSRAKVASLLDLCAKAEAGEIPSRAALLKMSDDDIIETLTAVRGIGVWSVEMLLIFNLRRLDVLPATDYGVRKGFAKVFGLEELPTPKAVVAHGERWRPYRSVASWYLWRATEE